MMGGAISDLWFHGCIGICSTILVEGLFTVLYDIIILRWEVYRSTCYSQQACCDKNPIYTCSEPK
jgi:hypothetical protein